MGSLAIALREQGWRVEGSDQVFYPPISDALSKAGIPTKSGWNAINLSDDIDLVVVGNVCRADNPEVLAAASLGLERTTLPALLAHEFIRDRVSIAVCGTHGKSTTTALLAWMLESGGLKPGFMVAAKANNFSQSVQRGALEAPFVLEADEYDTAFFEKTPKFWHYNAKHALWTSVEYDHADIYPDEAAYRAAFIGLRERLPDDGVIVAYAGDATIRELLRDASQHVIWYALEGDPVGGVTPTWSAAPSAHLEAEATRSPLALVPERPAAVQAFDLFTAGSYCGRFSSPLFGDHNLRNTLGALAMATEVCGLPMRAGLEALSRFAGLARRQQRLGIVRGIEFFDDFAHHPTAVAETLRAFRRRFPQRRLVCVFEPRSATACRAIHQDEYIRAFALADVLFLAPVGRTDIERPLDTQRIANILSREQQMPAFISNSYDFLKELLDQQLRKGDVVVFMSNGGFGDVREGALRNISDNPRDRDR